MARRVDHVDLDVAVLDGGVLGEDGDPALALKVVGIHDQRAGILRIAEDVRLLEETIDQRRLAMIDVRDDRDIAEIGSASDLKGLCHAWSFSDDVAVAKRRRMQEGRKVAVGWRRIRGRRRGGHGSKRPVP